MDIVFSSTTDLAAAIRTRRVSATETLDAHLAQIDKHNTTLNAVITVDAERARGRARAADEALARGELWGPLHGVPFTLKDCHATAGMRTTVGFPPLANNVPTEDSTVTARLLAAGGVLVGKTNVAMLLGDIQTENPLFGRTNNPWNIERTPGGSSGGAAAALAAGMTPFEIGTDLAASLRLPAHYCGVCCLKPTENRVPLTGLVAAMPGTPRAVRVMASIGPMARDAADLALLYQIIAGPDGRDTEVHPVPVEDVADIDLADIRVAVAPTFPGYPISTEVERAISDLARRLGDVCRAVEFAPLPALDYDASRIFEPAALGIGAFQPESSRPPAPVKQYFEALERRDQFIVGWDQYFDEWDVLLCPPSMVTAFRHCASGTPLRVDGDDASYWMANAHSTLFNYTGHPAVVLPYGQDADGLPIGVQLVGKRWSESRLIGIARAMSAVTGGFRRPAGY